MFQFTFNIGRSTWSDFRETEGAIGPDCKVEAKTTGETTAGIINSENKECIEGTRKRLMHTGAQVSPIGEESEEPVLEEVEEEVEEVEDLEFKTSSDALQYLSDITGKRVEIQ